MSEAICKAIINCAHDYVLEMATSSKVSQFDTCYV